MVDENHPNKYQPVIDTALASLNKLPNDALDQVSDSIKRFNEKKISEIPEDEITKLIDYLTYCFFALPYSVTADLVFWRVRTSDAGVRFKHTDELSYPPKTDIAGRVAFANEPVFYAASSPETAFAEARLKEGMTFHLTKYKCIAHENFNLTMIGDIDNLRRRGKTTTQSPEFQAAYEAVLKAVNPDLALAIQLVDAFLTDWVGRKGDNNVYRVSNAITNELMRHDRVAGIIFQSVEHAGGLNFAVKKESYDNWITPTETMACKVNKAYGYGAYQMLQSQPVPIRELGPIEWP